MIRRMVNGNKTPRTKKINTIENQISKIAFMFYFYSSQFFRIPI